MIKFDYIVVAFYDYKKLLLLWDSRYACMILAFTKHVWGQTQLVYFLMNGCLYGYIGKIEKKKPWL